MKTADPGTRDQRVTIYSDSGTTLDSVGQRTPNESSVGTYWAEVIQSGGRELNYAQQIQAETELVVKTIADSVTRAIAPLSHRFVWRNRSLGIIGVGQENYRDTTITFHCVEVK